jgi:hypothetical protein
MVGILGSSFQSEFSLNFIFILTYVFLIIFLFTVMAGKKKLQTDGGIFSSFPLFRGTHAEAEVHSFGGGVWRRIEFKLCIGRWSGWIAGPLRRFRPSDRISFLCCVEHPLVWVFAGLSP